VRLAGFEGDPQRLAGADQVLLAYDLVERARSKLFGQWSFCIWLTKQV
jgi:hypothetical protein